MQAAQIQFTEKLIAHGAVPAFQFPFPGGRIGRAVVSADENPRLFAAVPFQVTFFTEVCVSDCVCKSEV
jgi:hypothetical protein